MQFIQSFHSLGYSAINIVLLWIVAVAVFYKLAKLHERPAWLRMVFVAVMLVPLVSGTNFLAEQNRLLNDAIRSQGGLKRSLPKNFPKVGDQVAPAPAESEEQTGTDSTDTSN